MKNLKLYYHMLHNYLGGGFGRWNLDKSGVQACYLVAFLSNSLKLSNCFFFLFYNRLYSKHSCYTLLYFYEK